MNCLKSPVNRMGGKYYLTDRLSRYIPGHVCYVEPLCGAAALLFAKTPSAVEILNDIDNHLVNFFQVIQETEKRQALVNRLAFMPYSRSLWQDIRSRWKAGDIPCDEVERVSQWFFLNRTCFGGDQKRGGFACPSVTGRNPVQSFRNSVETFADVAERLKNVCIENLDYADCIKRYDSPDTLFYCDPPYYGSEHYYGKDFTQEDHHTLARLLNNVKGKVMLSQYQCDLYDKLYSGWNEYTFQSFKGSSKASSGESKPKTVECLYVNFEPPLRNKMLPGF